MRLSAIATIIYVVALLFGCNRNGGEKQQEFNAELATKLLSDGDYQQAADEAVRLAEAFPESAKAQFLAGVYLTKLSQEMGKYPDDSEMNARIFWYLDRSVKLGEGGVRMEWGAAVTYAAIGRESLAMDIFRANRNKKGFLTLQGYVDSFSSFAYLIAGSGDVSGALEVMDSALAANPGHNSLAQEKLKLLTEFSNIESVESFAQSFEQKFGFQLGVRYQVCSAYEYRQFREKAASCYKSLLALPDLSDDERKTILADIENI